MSYIGANTQQSLGRHSKNKYRQKPQVRHSIRVFNNSCVDHLTFLNSFPVLIDGTFIFIASNLMVFTRAYSYSFCLGYQYFVPLLIASC